MTISSQSADSRCISSLLNPQEALVNRFTQSVVVSAMLVCGLVLSAQDLDTSRSEMRATIERYSADRAIQNRSAPIDYSAAQVARMKQFYTDWLTSLDRLNFDAMGQDG